MKNLIYCFVLSLLILTSCNRKEEKESTSKTEPAFCDCVNHDYHNDGDKEKCDIIEKELTEKLDKATKDEKGEILMKIQDCKVKGQYDND